MTRPYQVQRHVPRCDFRDEALRRLDVEHVRRSLFATCGSRGFVSFSARRVEDRDTVVIHCYAPSGA